MSAVTLKHSTFLWLELHLRTRKVCKHPKKNNNQELKPFHFKICFNEWS